MGKFNKNGVLIFCVISGLLMFSSPSIAALVELDITGATTSGTLNNTFFSTTVLPAAGSGNFMPFVRVQANPIEKGYNTSGTLEFDTKSGTWTHPLQLGSIPSFTIGSTRYYEFMLDENESNNKDIYLSLDKIKIYTFSSGGATGFANFNTAGYPTLIYDLDGNGNDNRVLIYDWNSGSGQGDLFAYIPTSYFPSDPNTFIYFFSEFGDKGSEGSGNTAKDYGSSATFEEWAVRVTTPNNPVPEPGTMLLLGSGLVGLAGWGRKKFRK